MASGEEAVLLGALKEGLKGINNVGLRERGFEMAFIRVLVEVPEGLYKGLRAYTQLLHLLYHLFINASMCHSLR